MNEDSHKISPKDINDITYTSTPTSDIATPRKRTPSISPEIPPTELPSISPTLCMLITQGLAVYAWQPPEQETNLLTTATDFNAHWAPYEQLLARLELALGA